MIYLHLTNAGMEDAYQIINSVMSGRNTWSAFLIYPCSTRRP